VIYQTDIFFPSSECGKVQVLYISVCFSFNDPTL
jgi:hypothetical protein